MGITVFANGMSIACKAASGQTAAAMPDVCLSPPTPPAGPVPIPYPNTAAASDTDGGSTTVMIGGDMVMLKDQSTFKKSTGNEAATKSLPMGVVTACLTGEASFVAWSMDVKFEGANVPRHMDLMLHNEQCSPANTPPWLYADIAAANAGACQAQEQEAESKCQGTTQGRSPSGGANGLENCSDDCKAAKACVLRPFSDDGTFCCKPDSTGHHLVEVNNFTNESGRTPRALPRGGMAGVRVAYATTKEASERLPPFKNYREADAPCACAASTVGANSHGVMHAVQDSIRDAYARLRQDDPMPTSYESYWTYGEARDAGARAHKIANPHCNEECTRRALDAYHKDRAGIDENEPVRSAMDYSPSRSGLNDQQKGQIRQTVNFIMANG